MINRKYIALLFTLLVAACQKPGTSPSTNKTEKENTLGFAFGMESYKVKYTTGTYTRTVGRNNTAGDERVVKYTSSNDAIATVNHKGVVSFFTQGTVTITATKEAEGNHAKATTSYILYITMKAADKSTLAREIKRATRVHGNEVNLNYIDTSAITDMSWLFSNDTIYGYEYQAFNGDISKWDVAEVTNMSYMFNGATSFNQNISGWNVANVTNMSYMFNGTPSFNQDISEWNVARVTNMASMFRDATSFNQNISKWNVANVTDMSIMFSGATSFNQNISGWNVANVTNMIYMFQNATAFKKNLDAWGERINPAIKADNWIKAISMFKNSGLEDNLPSWCKNVEACKNLQ